MFKKLMLAGSAVAMMAAGTAHASDTVKVGIVLTLTTPRCHHRQTNESGF